MYCNRCGKKMEPHDTGICPACTREEYVKNTSVAEFSAKIKEIEREEKKRENKIMIAAIIAGFFFPVIWIVYLVYRNWEAIKKWAFSLSDSSYSSRTRSYSGGGSAGFSSSGDDSSENEKFVFTGGDGNVYESGGLFCDWSGNYIEWGSPFEDSRGNMVSFGSPFYDNRDNYVTWGSPFYDAGDNYVDPHG